MFPVDYEIREVITEAIEDGNQNGLYVSYDEVDTEKIGTVTLDLEEEDSEVKHLDLLKELETLVEVPKGSYISTFDDGLTFEVHDNDHKPLFRLVLT